MIIINVCMILLLIVLIFMILNLFNAIDKNAKKNAKEFEKFRDGFMKDFKNLLIEIQQKAVDKTQIKEKDEDKKVEISSNVNKAEIDNKRERMESLKKLHQLNAIAESLKCDQMELSNQFNTSDKSKNSDVNSIQNDVKQDDEFEASNNFSDS